jgi:hypothetical protein
LIVKRDHEKAAVEFSRKKSQEAQKSIYNKGMQDLPQKNTKSAKKRGSAGIPACRIADFPVRRTSLAQNAHELKMRQR